MTEQPGDVLDEAAKLLDALRRRMGDFGGFGGPTPGDDDVWGRATREEPQIATGAPECRHCPICRAIAMSRESGPDVGRHVREAGQSLLAAALDVVAAFDRTRPQDRSSGWAGHGGSAGSGGSTGPDGPAKPPGGSAGPADGDGNG